MTKSSAAFENAMPSSEARMSAVSKRSRLLHREDQTMDRILSLRNGLLRLPSSKGTRNNPSVPASRFSVRSGVLLISTNVISRPGNGPPSGSAELFTRVPRADSVFDPLPCCLVVAGPAAAAAAATVQRSTWPWSSGGVGKTPSLSLPPSHARWPVDCNTCWTQPCAAVNRTTHRVCSSVTSAAPVGHTSGLRM